MESTSESFSGSTLLLCVVTVSDGCFSGEVEDRSGPKAISILKRIFPEGRFRCALVPDDILQIQRCILQWCSHDSALIVTTGGTGFSKRDVTPEAVSSILDKRADAMASTIVNQGMPKTPLALLSRPVCGVRGRTLIVTLPGSPRAVEECLDILAPALPHAVCLLRDQERQVRAVHECNCSGSTSVNRYSPILSDSLVNRPRVSPFPMVEVETAHDCIAKVVQDYLLSDQKVLTLSPENSLGKVCVEEVIAVKPFPPFRASIKDGYAVRSGGCSTPRVRSFAATAGSAGTGTYNFSEVSSAVVTNSDLPQQTELASVNSEWCIRISTGAVVPEGADAVVQIEDTELIEKDANTDQELRIRIRKPPLAGQDIRPVGSDIPKNAVLLSAGDRINAADVGLLVMAGIRRLKTRQGPIVGVLSTGNELKQPTSDTVVSINNEQELGQISDSNRPMLLSLLGELGVTAVDLGIVVDAPLTLEKALQEAQARCDIIVSSGGVSMGEKDLIKSVLLKLGYTMHFGRVNVKPGKPTTFASNKEGRMVFALPGNPASAFVMFQLFVRYALSCMGVIRPQRELRARLRLDEPIRLDPRPEFLRGYLMELDSSSPEGLPVVRPAPENQQSSSLLSFRGSDVLIKVPGASNDKLQAVNGDIVLFRFL